MLCKKGNMLAYTPMRSRMIDSARFICNQVEDEHQQPCKDCIDRAAVMHTQFLLSFPREVMSVTQASMVRAIKFAATDS